MFEILFPLTGSFTDASALPHALEMARVTGARVHLVRVLESRRASDRPIDPVDWHIKKLEAEGALAEAAARFAEAGVPVEEVLLEGNPTEHLLHYAHRTGAELIVLAGGVGIEQAAAAAGHARPALAINAHGFVGDDARRAADTFFPPYAETMSRIGRERGWSGVTRAQFDAGLGPRGHLLVGEPEQVAEKILRQHEVFGNDRYLLQFSVGTVPHRDMLRAIELLGTEVAPLVRREVASRSA